MRTTTLRTTISAGAAVVILAVAVLAVTGCGGSSGSSGDVTFIAPSDFSVADYAGRPLVINYFGSWCPPCNAEAPDLATFSKDHPDVQFVGIAIKDTEASAGGFMKKYGLTYPVVLDDQSLSARDGITGVPTTIFYDAQGQEKDRIVGAASGEQFAASLAKAQ